MRWRSRKEPARGRPPRRAAIAPFRVHAVFITASCETRSRNAVVFGMISDRISLCIRTKQGKACACTAREVSKPPCRSHIGAVCVILLGLLAGSPGFTAEEDAPFPPKGDPPTGENDAKPETPVPAPAAEPVVRGPVTHKPWSDELRAFCAKRKIEIKEHGDL